MEFKFKGGNEYFGISRPHMDKSVSVAMGKLEGIKTVIDLGSGRGKMGVLVKKAFPDSNIIGVDANVDSQKWIGQFLPSIYSSSVRSEIIEFLNQPRDKVELIVAGDVFEHLTEDQLLVAFEKIKKITKYLLIVSPIQAEDDLTTGTNSEDRTGLEKHQIVLSPEKVQSFFPGSKVVFSDKKQTVNYKNENPYEKFTLLLEIN